MAKKDYNKIIMWLIGTAITILIATVSGTYILWKEIYTNRISSKMCEETLKLHRQVEYNALKKEIENLNKTCMKKIIFPEKKKDGEI